MTENEAIIRFDFIRCALLGGTKPHIMPNEENIGLVDAAINALEEVQQYRTIGTSEECRVAVEKQTAKRAFHQGCYGKNGEWHEWNGINGKPYELCPSCRANLCCEMPFDIKPKYCKNCGQKLDWRNEE